MINSRFSQLRSLEYKRHEITSNINYLNEDLIKKIGNDTLEEYIKYYMEKNNLSLVDIENIFLKFYLVSGKKADEKISLIKSLQKIIVENILLPDFTENKTETFQELDKIIENAEKRLYKILEKNKKGGFFSITAQNIDILQKEFEIYGNIEIREINIGGVFGTIYIENNHDSSFIARIPVRISNKEKIGGESNINLGISESNIIKYISEITIGEKEERYFHKEIEGKQISITLEKEINLYREYGNDEKSEYMIISVFMKNIILTDDFSIKRFKSILNSILNTTTEIINKIGTDSGFKHKQRNINFTNGESIEGLEEDIFKAYGVNNSEEEYEKFERLKVKLSEKITIEDIGGQEKAKSEINKIIKSIKFEEIMKSWGAKPTSGIIFEGPAGTGKTLLAKAIASEIDADVYNIKLTDIASSAYINEGSKNVKNLFSFIRYKSKQNDKKIIIILDELDALFTKRGNDRASQEDTKIVNTFLTEMSGLEDLGNVIFIGTTNLIENIDPAVIRSGRLTTKVKVDLPDEQGLEQIYQIHIDKIKKKSQKFANHINGISLNSIVQKSKGLSGADIEEVVRIIAEQKAMQEISGEKVTKISESDFFEAIEKVRNIGRKDNIGFIK